MIRAVKNYLATLTEQFGSSWNRFWFTPSSPATLGLLRIATGVVAFYWLLTFTPDLVRFFGPHGLLPLETIAQWRGAGSAWSNFSFLDYVHSPGALWFAHGASLVIVALFAAGVFARVTSVLSLIVVLSYVHRAPMLTSEFEPILALVMFYLCLAPSGVYFSIDAVRRRKSPDDGQLAPPLSLAATVATRLLQVHLTAIYVMMALGKFSAETWWTGDAIWWLVARPESPGFFLAHPLAGHPYLVNAWTHAQPFFELGFAVLVWNRLARPLMLALAVVMWGLLALATGLHLFCLMMVVANLAFVDPRLVRQIGGGADGDDAASRDIDSAS